MSFKCRYPRCDRVFDSKVGRAVHERLVHGPMHTEHQADLACPNCGDRYGTELGLQIHLEERHGIPSMTLDWIERRTFENLVYIYNDELHKIQSNNIIGGLLVENERSRLLREGVLVIEEFGRMGRPTVYKLSEEALRILSEMEGYEGQ